MKCLIGSWVRANSDFGDGFNWTTPGEILVKGLKSRYLTGTRSRKCATLAEVADKPEGELIAAYNSFINGAWGVPLNEDTNNEMCDNLLDIERQLKDIPVGTIVHFDGDGIETGGFT